MKPFGCQLRWEHICLAYCLISTFIIVVLVAIGFGDTLINPAYLLCISLLIISAAMTLLGQTTSVKRRISYLLVGLSCLALIVTACLTLWPMRLTYALSQASLHSLAQRIQTGEKITTPVQVGFFRVTKAELSPQGIVCLWTVPRPGGNTGFVQCPPDNIPFNLWSTISLDNQWQFITED
jgi:uncharacterized membrane protein YuzA (DUF378 family)